MRPSSPAVRPQPAAAGGATRPITVASVPASHVYVRHLSSEVDDGVRRLADPAPEAPHGPTSGRWWPPVMLQPDWVREHDFDLMHLQFGFDAWRPEQLRTLLEEVRARGRAFVYTVHDLRNPHHPDRGLHDAQLDVLVRGADALVTLTEGAAAEVERRWRRRPLVLPHPHVVDFETMARTARQRRHAPPAPFRVGLHVKSLRECMDPLAVLPVLRDAVRDLPDAVLQVNGHTDVLHPGGARYAPELATWLQAARDRGELELHVHDFLPDDELWRYLSALDVSVLPYRFGTHSGWLEACADLGTAVIAPTCGYYADQGPVHDYDMDEHHLDRESLHRAVIEAHRAGPPAPLAVAARRQQRARLAAGHAELYRALT